MKKLSLILFAIAFAFKTFSQEVPRFATSEEANAFIESKIESRLTPFLEEHDIDLSLFETYLIKVGFATPDSIGVGFVNFLNHLVVPVNEEIRFDLLCPEFLEEVVSMIGKFSNLRFQDLRYVYLSDYIGDIIDKCIEVLREQYRMQYGFRGFYSGRSYEFFDTSDDCNCVFIRQLRENTLLENFSIIFGDIVRAGVCSWFITFARDNIYTKEIFEKSIYQPFYLFSLYSFPHLPRVISGEAIFLYDFLDNREEIREASRIIVNLPSRSSPLSVRFIRTASGELKDVVFFDRGTSIKYEDLRVVREAFYNSYFPIGLFNGKKVSYFGWAIIFFEEANQ